jgi:hypothetical protein
MKTSDFKLRKVFYGGRINYYALLWNFDHISDQDEKEKYVKAWQAYCRKMVRLCDREIKKLLKENANDPEFMAQWKELQEERKINEDKKVEKICQRYLSGKNKEITSQ